MRNRSAPGGSDWQQPGLAGEKGSSAKVARLYRLLDGRAAAADERTLAREYLGERPEAAAWERFVQALLVANEFVFVD